MTHSEDADQRLRFLASDLVCIVCLCPIKRTLCLKRIKWLVVALGRETSSSSTVLANHIRHEFVCVVYIIV